ncbi:WecB/TagA/CpsF family glycosyltransferase [Methylobacterium sp. WL18]|uniref:WecB/TagA/CpsF family glycosyltransferase n=1 Tax=Methylobacterium sp. WL18 TaxID=2603897 RepID=UPI0011CB5ADC|nr:WecB/TagA/CpsF family glycosyltransferase [Methylobacterium sp. WL18]TXN63127.1 WecB/TagA/CpsF family glycosyltransferase [Methylobacterium sp. WL18]
MRDVEAPSPADSEPVSRDRAAPEPSTTVMLFGYGFHVGTASAIVTAVAARRSDGPRTIVTANVDHVVQLAEDADFRGAYARAAARTLDGMPLVWLARVASGRPAERITGHDLLACILADPPPYARRVFFVAARQDVADMLTTRLQAAGTTLLVMGVGAPKSEVWVDRQGRALGNPVVFCVGDALSVAAGCLPRAPWLMQRLGLEWVFRFLCAPRRLFRRYFIESWRFIGIAVRDRVSGRRD